MAWTRQRRDGLMARGLLRLVDAAEVGAVAAAGKLAESTSTGLALIAAQQGPPRAAAVRTQGPGGRRTRSPH